MTERIIITTVVTLFATSVAFAQMRYSRPRSSSSPTPTPTPLPLITPKEASLRSQSPPQKTLATPTPSRHTFGQPQTGLQRPTPIPTPAKQAYLQPQKSTQKTGTTLPLPQQAFRQAQAPLQAMTPVPPPPKPTPTPIAPPDINAYLNRQLASSKDNKFHLNANGKDLALTPFHVWAQKSTGPNSTSTCIDMKSDDGRIYDIDFVTTGRQVTGVQVHRINGESVR